MKRLSRTPHADRNQQTGRYTDTPPCDGCGKPVGTNYFTDDEVCGGSDGPGFYLCDRKRCQAKLEGLSVEERRRHYTATRQPAKSKAQHTPGPWRVMTPVRSQKRLVYCGIQTMVSGLDASPLGSVSVYIYNRDGEAVGKRDKWGCAEPSVPEAETMANAHLIAAAPDLLAALEDAEEYIRPKSEPSRSAKWGPNSAHVFDYRTALADKCRAALKKARGEE